MARCDFIHLMLAVAVEGSPLDAWCSFIGGGGRPVEDHLLTSITNGKLTTYSKFQMLRGGYRLSLGQTFVIDRQTDNETANLSFAARSVYVSLEYTVSRSVLDCPLLCLP